MPAAADDDVIVHGDAERLAGADDLPSDGDVGLGRGGVARGMVVHEDQRRCAELQRAFDDLAGVDRRVVDRAALLLLVLEQRVLAVEEEDVELLDLAVGDIRPAVIDQPVPRADTGRSRSSARIRRSAASRTDLSAATPLTPRPGS